jgi:hypothetical protein
MVNLPAGIGRVENTIVVTDFEVITGRNRIANAYFGFNPILPNQSVTLACH